MSLGCTTATPAWSSPATAACRPPSPAAGTVSFSPSRLGAVDTVYAMTIHKSQGSQFLAAAVLLPEPGSRLLTRELLYTAATRARRQLDHRRHRGRDPGRRRAPGGPGVGSEGAAVGGGLATNGRGIWPAPRASGGDVRAGARDRSRVRGAQPGAGPRAHDQLLDDRRGGDGASGPWCSPVPADFLTLCDVNHHHDGAQVWQTGHQYVVRPRSSPAPRGHGHTGDTGPRCAEP